MPARFIAACFCALAVLGGCTWPPQDPAARRETPEPSEPKEPSLVVEKPVDEEAPLPAESVDQRILDYVRNIDGISRRVNRWQDAPPEFGAKQPTRLADDAQEPQSSDSAAQPAITFKSAADSESRPAASADPRTLEPPVLANVTVRAEHPPKIRPAGEQDDGTSVNAPATTTHTPTTLREFVDWWVTQPDDTSFRRQLDARILHAAVGNYDQARRPLEVVPDEQQQMALRFVEAYIVLRERTLGEDPDQAAEAVLREVGELADALEPLTDLAIPTLLLCRAVRGYGCYDALESATFPSGVISEFVVYCEIDRFASQQQPGGLFESRFDMRTTILTRTGTRVLELDDRDIVDRCRTRRNDCFIPRLVRLPATLSPGEYVVKVTIIDKLADKAAEKRATFRVAAGF